MESFPDKRYEGGYAVGIRCGCGKDKNYTRLADGRIKLCPECGAVIGRVGRKVVAGNWDTGSSIIPVMPDR